MSTPWSDDLISGYLDHELDSETRQFVEQQLQRDPAKAALLKTIQQSRASLSGLPRYTLPRDLSADVLATAASPPRPVGTRRSRTPDAAADWKPAAAALSALAASLVLLTLFLWPGAADRRIAEGRQDVPSAVNEAESDELPAQSRPGAALVEELDSGGVNAKAGDANAGQVAANQSPGNLGGSGFGGFDRSPTPLEQAVRDRTETALDEDMSRTEGDDIQSDDIQSDEAENRAGGQESQLAMQGLGGGGSPARTQPSERADQAGASDDSNSKTAQADMRKQIQSKMPEPDSGHSPGVEFDEFRGSDPGLADRKSERPVVGAQAADLESAFPASGSEHSLPPVDQLVTVELSRQTLGDLDRIIREVNFQIVGDDDQPMDDAQDQLQAGAVSGDIDALYVDATPQDLEQLLKRLGGKQQIMPLPISDLALEIPPGLANRFKSSAQQPPGDPGSLDQTESLDTKRADLFQQGQGETDEESAEQSYRGLARRLSRIPVRGGIQPLGGAAEMYRQGPGARSRAGKDSSNAEPRSSAGIGPPVQAGESGDADREAAEGLGLAVAGDRKLRALIILIPVDVTGEPPARARDLFEPPAKQSNDAGSGKSGNRR